MCPLLKVVKFSTQYISFEWGHAEERGQMPPLPRGSSAYELGKVSASVNHNYY